MKKVYCQEVTKYLMQGWGLYEYPVIPQGREKPYQFMVKCNDNSDKPKIEEYILLDEKATRDIDRELMYPNICVKANRYIKLGYQPYGPVIEVQDSEGWSHQYLAMIRYKLW